MQSPVRAVFPSLTAIGELALGIDELAGVQALVRREFEYIRYGTDICILNRGVATGQTVAPSHDPTGTTADFAAQIKQICVTNPATPRRHLLIGNRTIRQSGALLRYAAKVVGSDADLGGIGIRASRAPCHLVARLRPPGRLP